MSLGEKLLSWFSRKRSPSFNTRKEAWDPIKWKWRVGMLSGEMGLSNTLRDILPKEPSPDGFVTPSGISLDTQMGWTGQPGGSYLDLNNRIIENFKYNIKSDNLLLSCGAQHANFCTIMATLAPGDKVVMGRPTWFQWEPLCSSLGANVKIVPSKEEHEWKWDMDELNEAVDKDTKMLLVCNPDNPTGRLYEPKEQKAIAEIAQDADAILLSDESFRGLELDAPSMSSLPFVNMYYNAVSSGSMSKPFTADGIRIGWAASQNKDLLAKLRVIYDISVEHVGGIDAIISWAANEPNTFKKNLAVHRKDAIDKRKVMADWMAKQSFFTSWIKPKCGFLSFPGWTYDIDSMDFLNLAWETKKLVFMAGSRYGVEKHVRFGMGRCTMEDFKISLSQLGEFLGRFK